MERVGEFETVTARGKPIVRVIWERPCSVSGALFRLTLPKSIPPEAATSSTTRFEHSADERRRKAIRKLKGQTSEPKPETVCNPVADHDHEMQPPVGLRRFLRRFAAGPTAAPSNPLSQQGKRRLAPWSLAAVCGGRAQAFDIVAMRRFAVVVRWCVPLKGSPKRPRARARWGSLRSRASDVTIISWDHATPETHKGGCNT